MQNTTKEYFIEEATKKLKEKLLEEQGILIRNTKNYEHFVLDIGELYYGLKRKEDLD